jgi:hypothetical protein
LALPSGSWRKINAGVAKEASRTQQIEEPIGMLEAYSQVDEALVDLAPDPVSFRRSEDLAFIEGMSQTLSTALIYGSHAATPEQFDGFATRYANLTTAGTSAVHNVHGGSGTGSDTTSVWLIQWGPDKVHLFYPRNSDTIGLTMKDDGLETVLDASSNPYKAYQSHFKSYIGLCVRDDRCVQRLANIESTGSSNIWSDDVTVRALREMPDGGAGAVMYANRTVLAQIDIDAKDRSNVWYNEKDVWGRPVMTFRGIPVRQVDAILNTETAIT